MSKIRDRDWANKVLSDAIARLQDISCVNRFSMAEDDVLELRAAGMWWQAERLQENWIPKYTNKHDIYTLAYSLRGDLLPYCDAALPAGSVRRKAQSPNDIDMVLAPKNMDTALERILTYLNPYKTSKAGEHEFGYEIKGVKVDFFLCEEQLFAPMLLCRTGSRRFNIKCRGYAKKKGMLLNRYGLFDRDTDEILCWRSELEILDMIGIGWVPPEERSL